ncbi:hypothetical protein O3M35_004485 [Rhynocoris fuscipes]|uniref:PX domain-containing protein kinase-like protein n=1 Tax=Rhynocoris fuscipes TaxID=488301 RepID=A0AAW1CHT5_9HEMI
MSIFERNLIRKVYIDDTYNYIAVIISSETTQGHTEYVIKVKRDLLSERQWLVHRRYNDFLSLHHSLLVANINLPLPPKKIIGNMNRNFIAERQTALQNYLDLILSHQLLSAQLVVKKFLDPQNYSNFKELGLNAITIGLRGENDIKILKMLPQIGSRFRKEHYLVKLNDCKQEMLLTWVPIGPDSPHDQKQINTLLKVLASIQHVNIASVLRSGVCNDGVWMIREIRKSGSILDTICGTTKSPWTELGLKKYSNYECRKPLPLQTIINIVSQILQALAFLHHKGIPFGHLHTGNIVYEDGLVKLLDVENGIIGIPHYYRMALLKIKQITSIQLLDVYCLGLSIFEMATGIPFLNQKEDFNNVPEQLRPILKSVLCVKTTRTALPTIADLLNYDIFRYMNRNPQPHIKMTVSARENFNISAENIIERLKKDYSKYRQEKRVMKVYKCFDENDGQILVYYTKKTKISKDDMNDHDRSESPCSINSNSNTTISTQSVPTPTTTSKINNDQTNDRQALLGAICNFNKDSLKKVNKQE